jgi:hypothetical protein
MTGIGDRGLGIGGAAIVAVACGCGGETGVFPPGPTSFRVTVAEGDLGAADARLPFSLEGTSYTIGVEALPAAEFADGWVAVRSQPGDVVAVEGAGVVRANVRLAAGRASGIRVTIAKAYGDARIWVEDIGFVPGPVLGSACGNGRDDDGDGRVDYGDDPGCAYSNDDSETEGSHAAGLGPVMYFENPRIADVQGLSSESTLLGRSVTIDRGEMVVVRVSVDGLYVTDREETRGYASLFAYNFNTPAGVRVCDRLVSLAGIVGEFYGYTELGYPSWTVNRDVPRPDVPSGPGECPVPDPAELTPAVLDDPIAMESLEAGLAQIGNGIVSARWEDCDFNDDGTVEFEGEEAACADACDAALDCTELTAYHEYGQFGMATAVDAEGNQGKVAVLTRESFPDFDPQANPGLVIPLVRGTLRQLEFIEPPWILEIRCQQDVVLSGTPPPMWQACVPPVPEDEDYTR